MPTKPLTVDDLWTLPRVGGAAPSPDGRQVVVPVTTYSMEANEGTTRLWLIPADAREAGAGGDHDRARPLTADEGSSGQPAWSPDGAALVFVRKPGGEPGAKGKGPQYPKQPQLYLLSLCGGEPRRLTDLPLGAADPKWFPDGRRVAFLSPVFRDALTLEATAERVRRKEEDPVKAEITEDRFYRLWDQWLTDGKIHHIFVLDLDTKTITDLTPGLKGWFDPQSPGGHYRIAPDGRQICFSTSRSSPPHDPFLTGVFTVEVPPKGRRVSSGAVRHLTAKYPADATRPVYSPDGRWILFGMVREIDFYADKVRLVAFDRESGEHTVLTDGWDRSADSWEFLDGGKSILIAAADRGRTSWYTLDFRAALRHPEKTTPKRIMRGGSFTEPRVAGGMIFTTVSSLMEPPEVACLAPGRRGLRRISAFTKAGLRNLKLSEVEEIYFKGAGGKRVQMFLLHPPAVRPVAKGRRPGYARRLPKPWPLVHMIHGGPHGAFGDEWHWRWNAQCFAAPGYLVALVNFHGSVGWGQEFAASILGSWGDQPYQDIMAATDLLVARGLADPKRMAATGGSYGGYLAAWIASQTGRFAAIVNHAGVSDFQTQYASDVTQGRARSMGGEPWENTAGMDRYNPMRFAAGFRSPMLVIHGERDYRVPHAQGLEIYNVYKAMRLPARLVCYPDENHWILKPRNSRLWYQEVLGWMKRWF